MIAALLVVLIVLPCLVCGLGWLFQLARSPGMAKPEPKRKPSAKPSVGCVVWRMQSRVPEL